MAAQPKPRPLFAPGNEAEWAKINEEEERQAAEFARSLAIPERLEFGQKLCDQAFDFYNAVHARDDGHGEIRGPDLSGVVADANACGLEHVVIGGFAVIAHGYFRATKDSDLLVPDGREADEAILCFLDRIRATRFSDGKVLTAEDVAGAHHLRVDSRHGVIGIMRGGLPPLDYETVAASAVEGSWRDSPFKVASLRSLVGFKRLAARPQDRLDLEALERVNGELPVDPIPGLDK
ncbi:MAG TPA: hypothetical protein VFY04_12270 [Solirubrobacterales bacterium]|nr:hypothetical protein [Solirubrobacterales bacterium]